jgi:heme-degrading monooxygenase HmoA
MWVRMSTFKGPQSVSDEAMEQNLEMARTQVLPALQQMDGFRGVVFAGDRDSGESVTLTFWDGPESLQASEEAAARLREDSAEQMGEDVSDVRRYEVFMNELPAM